MQTGLSCNRNLGIQKDGRERSATAVRERIRPALAIMRDEPPNGHGLHRVCHDADRAVVSGSRDTEQNYTIVCAERGRQITRDHSGSLVPRSPSKRIRHCVQGSTFAHVGGFAAHQEVLPRWCEEIDHLSVFAKPCLVLRASWNDHDVARTANSLFGAEAELHLALEHPRDLFICVTVRLNMDAGPYAPPDEHTLITG